MKFDVKTCRIISKQKIATDTYDFTLFAGELAQMAINNHSRDFWFFIGILVAVLALIYAWKKRLRPDEIKTSKGMKAILFVLAAVVVVYLVGALLSSPIVNAKKYQKLLKVEEGEFTKDIEELSFDQIPLLDKESATLLGNRKMGSMVDMVSQFEVDDIYSQINYQGRPVRSNMPVVLNGSRISLKESRRMSVLIWPHSLQSL